MHKLMEFVCGELEELEHKVAKEGKLSRTELEDVKNLTEVKKNILKAEMLSEQSEYSGAMSGYSRRGSYADRSYADGSYADMSYADDGRGDFVRPDGSYRYATPEASYARGRRGNVRRDAMGRYSRSGDISEDLEKLMNKTDDERVKDEIRRLMERM